MWGSFLLNSISEWPEIQNEKNVELQAESINLSRPIPLAQMEPEECIYGVNNQILYPIIVGSYKNQKCIVSIYDFLD